MEGRNIFMTENNHIEKELKIVKKKMQMNGKIIKRKIGD